MKILKSSTDKKIICPNCDCLFAFTNDDFIIMWTKQKGVQCPNCGTFIWWDDWWDGPEKLNPTYPTCYTSEIEFNNNISNITTLCDFTYEL